MSYFTPSTSRPGRGTTCSTSTRRTRSSARTRKIIREPYVTNNRDAVWVGNRIASVIENPTPLWWYIAVFHRGRSRLA